MTARERMERRARERFFSYVLKTDDCWIWVAGRNSRTRWGHGQFRIPGTTKRVQAHRFSYELAGRTIPDGFHLHHVCENPLCVRPSHLKPMSGLDHMRFHVVKPCQHGNPTTKCLVCNEPKKRKSGLTYRQRYVPIALANCERKLAVLRAEFAELFGVSIEEHRLAAAQ